MKTRLLGRRAPPGRAGSALAPADRAEGSRRATACGSAFRSANRAVVAGPPRRGASPAGGFAGARPGAGAVGTGPGSAWRKETTRPPGDPRPPKAPDQLPATPAA